MFILRAELAQRDHIPFRTAESDLGLLAPPDAAKVITDPKYAIKARIAPYLGFLPSQVRDIEGAEHRRFFDPGVARTKGGLEAWGGVGVPVLKNGKHLGEVAGRAVLHSGETRRFGVDDGFMAKQKEDLEALAGPVAQIDSTAYPDYSDPAYHGTLDVEPRQPTLASRARF